MPSIYSPSEDSYLLSSILKEQLPKLVEQNPNLKFLEIGVGSGIHLWTANNSGVKKENIYSCDINKKAVAHCNVLGFNCIESNLFENIGGKYDIIIFNPPYLPEDTKEPEDSKVVTTGGERGDEIIIRFLRQVKDYLEPKGKAFLLTSSLTPMENIKKEFENYCIRLLGREKLFYEELSVWELC